MHVKGGDPIADVAGSPADGTETGTTYTLKAGDYAVSETDGPSGYTQTGISGACDESGDVTLAVGDDVTCTITNDDVALKLTLKKHVVNNDGGTSAASTGPCTSRAADPPTLAAAPLTAPRRDDLHPEGRRLRGQRDRRPERLHPDRDQRRLR